MHVLPNVQKHILLKSNYAENQESEQIVLEKWDILNLSICELKFDISHFFTINSDIWKRKANGIRNTKRVFWMK